MKLLIKITLFTCLLCIIAVPSLARASEVQTPSVAISLSGWVTSTPSVKSTSTRLSGMGVDVNTYTDKAGRRLSVTIMHIPEGDDVYFLKYESKTTARDDPVMRISVVAKYGAAFPLLSVSKRTIIPIMSIKVPTIVEYAGPSLYLRPTEQYTSKGYTMIDWNSTGNIPVAVTYSNGGSMYSITMRASGGKYASTWFVVSSAGKLIDFSNKSQAAFAPLLALDTYQRLFADGCYERIATTYLPIAAHGYWRNPASIPGNWIAEAESVPGTSGMLGKDVAYVIAAAMISTQSSNGYWTIGPASTWLKKEYGITYGYFDDRRATDGALFLSRFASLFSEPAANEAVSRYSAWLALYAEKYALKMSNGGLLIPDYIQIGGTAPRCSHVALNHQLANINYCFESGIASKSLSRIALGKRLLLGVNATVNRWIMPNHNLVYALTRQLVAYPYPDYVYLTRDDLVRTKSFCEALSIDDSSIVRLLSEKNQWIDGLSSGN